MDPFGIVGPEPERDRLHGRGRPGHRDERSRIGDRDRALDVVQQLADGRSHPVQVGRRRRVAADEALGQPDAPHLRRDRGGRIAPSPGRTRSSRPRCRARGRAPGRPGLGWRRGTRAATPRPRSRSRASDPVSSRTGRSNASAFEASRTAAVAPTWIRSTWSARARRTYRAITSSVRSSGVGGEPAGLVDALAEPGDDHVARELLEAAPPPARRRADGSSSSPGPPRPRGRRRSSWIGSTVVATHAPTTSSPAGQVVGVVRVEALEPSPGPADPAVLLGAGIVARAFPRVLGVGPSDRIRELGSASNRSFSLEIQPSASTRETARPRRGTSARTSWGTDRRARPPGALRMTRGCPPGQRATTVNGTVGARPSCSATIRRSLPRSSPKAGRYLRLCSTERLKSTWRSSLWRMNFFRRASKSGSEPRR